jgi:hypothetical protein
MHEGLVELSLLLEDRGQVAVGCRELRKDLEGLQVEPRRILDVALLALYVGLKNATPWSFFSFLSFFLSTVTCKYLGLQYYE